MKCSPIASWLLLVALIGCNASPPQRPNVVLIMADDMGYSDIGCYGGEIDTPHLDSLAAGGLRFTQFYNGARCCPTRASLLTGLYAHQAGMGSMESDWKLPGYRGNINKQCVTIAEALRLSGYRTYMSGKWHVTNVRKAKVEADKYNWPLQRGFDRFCGTITGAGSFYAPATLTQGNTDISASAEENEEFFYTDVIGEQAARFIREHASSGDPSPFFEYVAYTAPHWPLHARKQTIEKYRGKYMEGWDALREERHARMKQEGLVEAAWPLSERPGFVPTFEELARRELTGPLSETPGLSQENVLEMMDLKMAIYAAMIDEMDQSIGVILDALRETGQLENTLVLFLADNGACAEYGLTGFGKGEANGLEKIGGPESFASYGGGWANASNTPFRFFKHDTQEGGIATPLIVHWPAGVTESGLRKQVGHIIDLMPTILDVCSAPYPSEHAGETIKPMEGISLVPAFDDNAVARGDPLFWEHHGNRAIRDGRWKLVARGENGPWELFDVVDDRTETKDLAEAQPERVATLEQAWLEWAKRADVLPMNPNSKKANNK